MALASCKVSDAMYHLLGQKGVTVIDAAAVQDQETAVQLFPCPGAKKEKEFVKAVYCHPVYLIYMQSTS